MAEVVVVTDSNAQLPTWLAQRYGIIVVPLHVSVGNEHHLEGVDLDVDDFYRAMTKGRDVATAAPSPDALLSAYRAAAAAGAEAVVSVHIGAQLSATVAAATLASRESSVPVEVVDTASASFGVGLCAWRAAEVAISGGDAATAANAARQTAEGLGNIFAVGTLGPARRGGRLATGVADRGDIAVLALTDGAMSEVVHVADMGLAAEVMVDHIAAAARRKGQLRVGVGDGWAAELGDALEKRVAQLDGVAEVVRYTVGPSVGAHTGPGTAGAVFCPAPGA